MSSEGLPVNNVVGTSVDLGARSVQDAANSASSSQNADSAAASADAAWKFSRVAQGAAEESSSAVSDAEAAAAAASASAQNATIAANIYPSVAAGQAAIDSGTIPLNAMFNVAVPAGTAPPRFADQYQNVAGVATPTGQTVASGKTIDMLAVLIDHINSILTPIVPPDYKVTWNDLLGNFSVGIKNDGTHVSGSSEIAGVRIGADINGYATAFYDTLKNACVAITASGLLKAGSASINNLSAMINLAMPDGSTLNKTLPDGFVLAFMNMHKEAVAGIKDNGTLVLGSTEANKITATSINSPSLGVLRGGSGTKILSRRLADIIHIVCYGQSLSTGVGTAPLQTTLPLYNAVKFNGGVRPQDGGSNTASNHASFQPYVETMAITNNGPAYETPLGGCIKMMYDLTIQENYNFTTGSMRVLGSAPGEGAQSIAALSETGPGTYMQRLSDGMTYGASLSQTACKTYEPIAMLWIQGETDQSAGTSVSTYMSTFDSMMANINGYASNATGETISKLPVFTYQFNSWINRVPNTAYPTIPLALLELSKTRDYVVMACPMYMFDYSDEAHLTGASSRIFGAYMGVAIKRTVFDGVKFQPLSPIDHLVQGRVLNVRFNPVGNLVFDTSIVSNPGNYGFSLVDSVGSDLAISSVTCNYQTVTVVASAVIPAGAKLRYGFIGGTTGQLPSRTSGPRGNLRDCQGDQIVFDPNGSNRRMDNYSVVFELTL